MKNPVIVDAHEDIAFNAIMLKRDFLLDISKLRSVDSAPREKEGTPTVCLPELEKGNVRVVFATVWVAPCGKSGVDTSKCYGTAEEAHSQGLEQLAYYRKLEREGRIRIIQTRDDLREHLKSDNGAKVGFVFLMEGADPIRAPKEAKEWFNAGIRIIGPAWKRTRYAGGTGEPGPLSPEGKELMKEMESIGFILDTSHFAEESFYEALDLFHGPVIASHANSRVLTPTDRQLTDEMIKALIHRGGVIGTVFYNNFLDPKWVERGKIKNEITFSTVFSHMNRICDLAGDRGHIAIGTDFDGGFGLESTPAEINTVADLQKFGPFLQQESDFSEEETAGVLGGNWLRVLERALP